VEYHKGVPREGSNKVGSPILLSQRGSPRESRKGGPPWGVHKVLFQGLSPKGFPWGVSQGGFLKGCTQVGPPRLAHRGVSPSGVPQGGVQRGVPQRGPRSKDPHWWSPDGDPRVLSPKGVAPRFVTQKGYSKGVPHACSHTGVSHAWSPMGGPKWVFHQVGSHMGSPPRKVTHGSPTIEVPQGGTHIGVPQWGSHKVDTQERSQWGSPNGVPTNFVPEVGSSKAEVPHGRYQNRVI
jgi:hypothetical protein